jgi:hypothetical protein
MKTKSSDKPMKKGKITVKEADTSKKQAKLTHDQTAQALAEELSAVSEEVILQKTPKGRCTIVSVVESPTLMCFCFNGGSVTVSDKLDQTKHLFSEMKRSYENTERAGKFVRMYLRGHHDKALTIKLKPSRWDKNEATSED